MSYEIHVRYTDPVNGKPCLWTLGRAETLDEAKSECERNADRLYGEGLVLERGLIIAVSNCGASCENPRTLVKRPHH